MSPRYEYEAALQELMQMLEDKLLTAESAFTQYSLIFNINKEE